MTDFERLLAALTGSDVEFIVIGGFAATAHGSAHLTVDLDLVYRRTPDNIARLAEALEPLRPYLRGAPPGLPFRFDVDTIGQGLNFTLVTLAGDLDLLGEATGGGTYEALLPRSELRDPAYCPSWNASGPRPLPAGGFDRSEASLIGHHLSSGCGEGACVVLGQICMLC